MASARETGDAVKTAKAERLLSAVTASPAVPVPQSCPSDAGLIGRKLDLPSGGESFETVTALVPCVYKVSGC